MNKIIFAFLLLPFFSISCSDDTSDGKVSKIPEVFDIADRPVIAHDAVEDFELLKPWNYDKSFNSERLYPLVVSLHGSGGSHYKPCIVGDDKEMQDHPCFFLAPTCSSWGGSADAWVRTRIESLKKEYRIDSNRIYLMGFSMGGSGSYSFAAAYYAEYAGLFAGIVRLAGQSQTSLRNEIANKTSVWYHIGLVDDAARVTVAEDAYQFMKKYSGNTAAVETIVSDTLSSYPRTTKTLTKNGIEIMKKSEYTGMGHDGGTAFNDPAVLDWLFSQSLSQR
jgi:predicted peptidase